jgi:serine/threonine-protein phosphatase 2A activator
LANAHYRLKFYADDADAQTRIRATKSNKKLQLIHPRDYPRRYDQLVGLHHLVADSISISTRSSREFYGRLLPLKKKMQPTSAPWKQTTSETNPNAAPLPPVARGETTVAPWARSAGNPGPSTPAGRPLQVTIPAESRFPQPISDVEAHTFIPASKRIASIALLRTFLTSSVAADFVSFLLALNTAVRGRSLQEAVEESEEIASLVSALNTLDSWVTDIPPAPHTLRYGNPAFRAWFARLRSEAPRLVSDVLPPPLRRPDVLAELVPFFIDSFGNETRIDYGTGHETTFAALLYCLARLGVLRATDAFNIVAKVFERYLHLMRRVQTTYWLEPAGSHGVWGLDDYQFLPFVWGSAQLVEHPYLKPSAIHSDELLEVHAEGYLYLAAVRFVRQVKKGPLGETSPMLSDISGVPSWSKINKGMVKMYEAEVLGRLPIMQHFLFGSLLPFPETQAAHGC